MWAATSRVQGGGGGALWGKAPNEDQEHEVRTMFHSLRLIMRGFRASSPSLCGGATISVVLVLQAFAAAVEAWRRGRSGSNNKDEDAAAAPLVVTREEQDRRRSALDRAAKDLQAKL